MPKNLFKRGPTYYARFFVRGELQRVSLRTGDPREARERLKALKLKAERQAFGIESAATWDDAVVSYCAGVLDAGSVKPGTAKRYRVSLRQLDLHFRGKPLPLITVPEIARYVTERQRDGATNATIRRDITTMSRVLSFAAASGAVQANAAAAYDRSLLRERRAAIQAPDDAAVEAGAKAAEAAGDATLADLIRFLRANGMRAGEALRSKREHIHGMELTIPETKNGRVRTIDLAAGSVPPGNASGRLFPGLPAETGALASRWQYIRRALPKEQHFRLHDLRHAYAIAEIRAGRDIYDLSHHLGHSSVKVTEIYLGYAKGGRSKSRKQVTHQVTQSELANPDQSEAETALEP